MATLLGLIAVVYVCSHTFLLNSFGSLERQETARNVLRASDAIAQEAERIHGLSADWSDWDDTYKFMGDKNKAYIDANLSVVTLKLDLMMYLDTSGNVFYARKVDRVKGVGPPDPLEVRHALKFDQARANWPVKNLNGISGVVKLPEGPMIVSVRPIRKTSQEGSVKGWIVFGYWLNAEAVTEVAHTTHLKLDLMSLESGMDKAPFRKAMGEIQGPRSVSLQTLDRQTIAGYTFVYDVFGAPVGMLKVSDKRAIYLQGAQSVDFVVRLLIISAVVFGFVILWVLEVAALGRVFKLTNQVESLTEEESDDGRVTLGGSDELATLASQINRMLGKIHESRSLLKTKNDSLNRVIEELRTSNNALENAVEGIARLDSTGRICAANASFADAFKLDLDHVTGIAWTSLVAEGSKELFAENSAHLSVTGKRSFETEGVRSDGEKFFAECVLFPIEADHGGDRSCYWFLKDISDRKLLEVQIQYQAYHDSLTGLPNRLLFLDRLDGALLRSKRHGEAVGVVFIDLDNFKVINDSLGHEAGDNLLVAVAQVLRACIRPEDTVARLGGDEFTILLSELSSVEEVVAIVERIIDAFRRPVLLSSGVAFVSASFGVTYSQGGSATSDEMLRDADTAMYCAKNQGKASYVIFDPSMNVAAVARMELESDLRKAIELDDFFLVYQPLIDLESGRVTGMEALLRWQHPQRGLVMPMEFIPVAEETGLIVPIGAWVLEQACLHTKDWNLRYGCELSVSVNLSGMQLQKADIVETIAEILTRTGFDPRLLTLEITEGVLMKDSHGASDKLHRLKSLGVRLAIDDFGTGYSSMSCLGIFPVDNVKIDRSFIEVMGESTSSEAIVAAMVTLSKKMQFEVTAEGIEVREQLLQLKKLGCNSAQGFLFYRPMSHDEFESELADNLLSKSLEDETAA